MNKTQFYSLLAFSILNGVLLVFAPFDYFWFFSIVVGVGTIVFLIVIVMDIFGNTAYWKTALQLLLLGYLSLGVEFLINFFMKY